MSYYYKMHPFFDSLLDMIKTERFFAGKAIK